MKHLKLRKQVIETCLLINSLGINQGTSGNVSVRVPDGFLISPSGIPYADLTPQKIVFMDIEGGYYGDFLPSSEWQMHRDIFAQRPEAGAIVHTHSRYATTLSCLREGIPAFHYMVAVAGGDSVRCADYATFGTKALSGSMLKALEGRRACLLANHGVIAFHETLPKALSVAQEIESLAAQYHAARTIGEPVILSGEEISAVLEKFSAYGKQPDELEASAPSAFEHPVKRD